ncbi:serine/threonine-protein kinase fray2 [Rhodamnia argentea]|uniref:Serine/threonine-protein kinase fray2 n=1 Tax=Rhodamnia argentea TaxID=178133 RepID=A0ABM3HQH5_9MYRT|nr:serine/threonine-protein kinase fray2 [Rhodamnia argentea]
MEEEKAAAYYDELTRKGEGAARFKQGLGFSASSDSAPPARGSAFVSASSSSSSSFLSNFVKASSPTKTSQFEKQSHLESIQNKLRKKPDDADRHQSRVSDRNERGDRGSRRHRSRSAERERRSRRRSRSRDRDRYREKDRDRDGERDRDRRRRSRSRGRSASPRRSGGARGASPRERRRPEKSRSDYREKNEMERSGKEQNGGGKAVDYSRFIDGYDKMTAAEKVKAKMKLQLAETAEKDESNGMGPGWERFNFDKDAPVDDEEIEAAEDDAALVKHIGQSFRFSAVEARREEQIKTAHDEAMFGSSRTLSVEEQEPNVENENKSVENIPAASLVSEKVLARQQGSWRDRARKA